MTVEILKDYHGLSEHAADLLIDQIRQKKNTVLCFASGDTPRLTLQIMVEKAKAEGLDCSELQFFGLDEWVGVPPEAPGSCSSFFTRPFFHLCKFPRKTFTYLMLWPPTFEKSV